MLRGSHSFTCHPHSYPRMERAITTTIGVSRPTRTYQTYRAAPPTFLIWNNLRDLVYQRPASYQKLPESDCGYLTATPLVGLEKHPSCVSSSGHMQLTASRRPLCSDTHSADIISQTGSEVDPHNPATRFQSAMTSLVTKLLPE